MRKVTCVCDWCKKEVEVTPTLVSLTQRSFFSFRDVTYDLCAECTDEITNRLLSKETVTIKAIEYGNSLDDSFTVNKHKNKKRFW